MSLRIFTAAVALFFTGCISLPLPGPHETITRNITYARRGSQDLAVDLYVPRENRPVPIVVWFHGGGWKYGDKGLMLHVRRLTRSGIAVAAVQYRRSWEAPWPAQRDDAAAAIRWVRQHGSEYGIDGNRLGLCGDSAGGHIAALMGLTLGKPRVRAVCAMYPPTDMIALAERFRSSERRNLITQLFDGTLQKKRAVMIEASPVNHVSRNAPPFYFLHGGRDKIVPIEQSRELHARLGAAGISTRLDEFPDKKHGFALDDAMLKGVVVFFQQNLKPN